MSSNFEVATISSFRDIKTNHFVTAAEAADIDDSISGENAFEFRCKIQMAAYLTD